MRLKPKYRLTEFVNALPRSANPTKDLQEKGIPERTFYRDKAIAHGSTQTISGDRMVIYAQYFNVTMEQLFTVAPKAKSKIKTQLK